MGGVPTKQYGSCQLRTYALALSATGEYTAFHGGTVALAQAAQATTMNRVNGVYEREMAITMVIVPNNNLNIYTNAAIDPFTNGTPGNMINENVTVCNANIGSANYDIGHVFGTNSGGLAGLGVVCGTSKARGVTGSGMPIGDAFDIDYVAHEMGHQFNANHTQNNACNRNGPTAAETGSGITIMGYAGICSPDVGPNSIDHFHAVSLTEISGFILGTGNSCATVTSLTNTAPLISATSGNIFVPISTPFALTCTATDADNDALTYNWEQTDVQVSTQPPVSTATGGPSFRSYTSSTNPTRYFPNLNNLASNGPYTWESLPSVARTMNFRISVRDNHLGGGCSDHDNVTVTTVATAGPFVVTYPNASGISLSGGSVISATWNVANTTAAPISASTVNIYLSTDGGITYPTVLVSGTANDGSQTVTLPNINTTTARIMVRSGSGTFFDISDNNFAITQVISGFNISSNPSTNSVCQGSNAVYTISTTSINSYSTPINLTLSNLPSGATAVFSPSTINPGQTSTLTISNASAGSYNMTVTGTSGAISNPTPISLSVLTTSLSPVTLLSPSIGATGITNTVAFTWSSMPSVNYSIEIATSPSFTTLFAQASGLTAASYSGPVFANSTTYYWRVSATNGCATSAFSQGSFTMATCNTYSSTNVPVSISSSGTPTITSTINVPLTGTILGVTVPNISGTHTWVSDLTFTLISPNATSVTLLSGVCTNMDNFNLGFDATSASTSIPCPPTTGLMYQPQGNLTTLNGAASQGIWTLQVSDAFNQDGGSLNAWSLNICIASACTPIVPIIAGTYSSSNTLVEGTPTTFSTSTCDLLGSITDPVGGNVLGSTTMSSTLLATVGAPNVDGYVYGRRSYSLSPSSDGIGEIKLYFTQADFDNYNANNAGFLDLPSTGNNGDPNKDYFRLVTVTGSGYTISTPLGTSLNWNGSNWEFTITLNSLNANFYFTTMPSCVGVNVNNLQATSITGTSVVMTWNNVVTTPSWGWYSLQYRIVGSPLWTFGGTSNNGVTSKLLTNLSAGTNYEVQIRRHCSSQSEGPWSSSVFFTTLSTGCAAPLTLNTTVNSTPNSLTVTWSPIAGAGWYEFRYKLNSSSTWLSGGTVAGSSSSKTISGLQSGQNYDIQGRSFCPNGIASAWSNTVNGTTNSSGCSLPPALSLLNATANSITISWPAVPGASWYSFQYKASSSSTWLFGGTANGTATSKMYVGLLPNTAYDFQARSYCSNNISGAWSLTGQFSTLGSSAIFTSNNDKVSELVMKKGDVNTEMITLFPNPAQNTVQLKFVAPEDQVKAEVFITDMFGRKISNSEYECLVGEHLISLDISSLNSGSYLVLLYMNKELFTISKLNKNE